MRSDIVILLAMCTFAFLVLGAFFAIKMLPETNVKVGALFSTYFDNRDERSFTLGSVKLGTTIDQVRNRHEKAVKGVTSDGSITLAFVDGTERYIVWYGENGPQHIAYKARQVRELHGVTEDEFIGSIAERYGAPSLSTCSRRIVDGVRDCQFSWWIPGEIRLDINSRQDSHSTTPILKITQQITDTRMDGRLHRIVQTTQAPKAY
jgi:hypothetical protein